MTKEFENLLNREGNGSLKWDNDYIQSRFGLTDFQEFFPLFIADMDFQMDYEMHMEMEKQMANPDFGYFRMKDNFFNSVINWHKNVNEIELEKEWIVPSIGTVTSLTIASYVFGKGRNFLLMTPIYSHLTECSKFSNLVTLPLINLEGRYCIDEKKFEEMAQAKAFDILIFCNPHNPSGRMWSKDELEYIVRLCKENGIMILVDEIHSDLNLTNERFVSMIEFHDIYNQIFVSTSANKTFNISGLNTSYVICADERLREAYNDFLNRFHLSANRFGLKMHEIAYDYGARRRLHLIQNVKENMALAKSYLTHEDIQVFEPDFGYLLWVKLDKVDDVDAFVLELAKETNVLLETGSRFVDNYEGFLRINVATSKEILEKAMMLFERFYRNY